MLQQTAIHSRSSSRDSVDSVIENKNYRGERPSSGSSTSSQKQMTCNSSQNSRTLNSDRTPSNNNLNSLDVYGTLPRKGKTCNKSQSVPNNLNQQQRGVNGGRSSRSTTPTPFDSSSTDSESQYQMQKPAKPQIVTNVAEIRPLHNNSGPLRAVHSQPNMHPQYNKSKTTTPSSAPEVCSSPASQQMTAKAQPVLPPKPNQATERAVSTLPYPKKEGSAGPYQKTATYKAGKPAFAPSLPSSIQFHSATISSSRRPLSRHASFTQPRPVSGGSSSVFGTRTLERYASQPDCQNLASLQSDTTGTNTLPVPLGPLMFIKNSKSNLNH